MCFLALAWQNTWLLIGATKNSWPWYLPQPPWRLEPVTFFRSSVGRGLPIRKTSGLVHGLPGDFSCLQRLFTPGTSQQR
jgi:hypothetical protein